MSPFKFFRIYWAVKLHFTSTSFNMFKYANPPKITLDEFGARGDYNIFESYSKKMIDDRYALEFCAFNFTKNQMWLYESYEIAKECYLNKKKFFGVFKENIKNENEKIQRIKVEKSLTFNQLIQPTVSGNKAPLLQMYLHDIVSLEYICMVDSSFNFVDDWSDQNKLDPLVTSEMFKIKKYEPFVRKFSG